MKVQFDNIPDELKRLDQWVCWKYKRRANQPKPTKVPVQTSGFEAKSTDSRTWTEYQSAKNASSHFAGIGFVFSKDDPYVGIDLDDCVDKQTGVIADWARDFLQMADTYSEISPSGTGIKMWLKGEHPESRGRKKKYESGEVEMYSHTRYFTMTGNVIAGLSTEIHDCQEAIDEIYRRVFGEKTSDNADPSGIKFKIYEKSTKPELDFSDQQLIDKILTSKQAVKFDRLWRGDMSDYLKEDGEIDRSRAEQALCSILAFWTQGNRDRIDSLFRQSKLYPGKDWDRDSYRNPTLDRAIAGTHEFYQPGKSSDSQKTHSQAAGDEVGVETGNVSGERELDAHSDDEIDYQPTIDTDADFDYEMLVPKGSWLDRYCEWIYPTTDAPGQFAIAGGLSVLSMVLRKMYVRMGATNVRPNIWLSIVAPSTLYRKSTSINIPNQLLNEFEQGVAFPSQLSPEAFCQLLAEGRSYGQFVWSELASALASFERNYMGGFMADLTNLYDCPDVWQRRTMKDGLVEVKNPFVNILAASTQDWLQQCLTEGNTRGGFLPRFIWVMANQKTRSLPFPEPPDLYIKQGLLEGLEQMFTMFNGGLTLSEDSRQRYSESYYALEKEAQAEDLYEATLGAFYGRLNTYTIKFAIIYQAIIQQAEYPDDHNRVIETDAMGFAIRLTNYLKESIRKLLPNITSDEFERQRMKVLNIIKRKPGITRTDLVRASRFSKRQLNDTLDTLFDAEMITTRREEGKTKPKILFYPLKESS